MAVPSISKIYSDACTSKPKSYYNYDEYQIDVGNIDNYRIIERIGRGRYSEVFKGMHVSSKSLVAIKVLKPVREKKINREILILKKLKHKNIIQMLDVVQDTDSQTYSIIFEYFQHKETRVLMNDLEYDEFIFYMRLVLDGISFAHSKGIIHRDLKPQNLIIDREKKLLKIIDWGLAEFLFTAS